MTCTLDDIAAVVNMEVGNTQDHGTAHFDGKAGVTDFLIAPPFRSVVDDGEFSFLVNGAPDTTGTMDFANGIFSAAQDYAGMSLDWKFNYIYWTKAQVFAAVNAGIGMLFPGFYVTKREVIEADGSTKEYVATTPRIEELRSIQGMRRSAVELDYDGDDTIVRFFSAPSGSMTASFICRPKELDTNEDELDVPDRALSPIVSYACYHLLNQKQAPRLRADIAVATVGGGNLSPRQMNDAANSFLFRFQNQMEHLKMRPWRTK